MRKSIMLTGVTTAAAAAAIAAPAALAQAPASPSIHIRNCTVNQSRNAGGFAWASCSIVGSDVPSQGVRLTYKTNMKTFNPGTPGPWRGTSGTVGFPGGDSILALKFGFKGKTVAQVRKTLTVTIAAPAGAGVTITDATAVAVPATTAS